MAFPKNPFIFFKRSFRAGSSQALEGLQKVYNPRETLYFSQ